MTTKKIYSGDKLELFLPEAIDAISFPLVEAGIAAGFPSPAEDYLDASMDLNKELIKNPSSTFFGRVRGDSMKNAGICDGDILVIDKSLEPQKNSILVCFVDGEFTIKKISKIDNDYFLMPENTDFKPIKISPESDFRLWGVVTYCIHKL